MSHGTHTYDSGGVYNAENIYINQVPLMSEDLIKQLDHDYPAITPEPTDSVMKIMFEAGRRRLIDTLLERMAGTNMAQLKGDIEI